MFDGIVGNSFITPGGGVDPSQVEESANLQAWWDIEDSDITIIESGGKDVVDVVSDLSGNSNPLDNAVSDGLMDNANAFVLTPDSLNGLATAVREDTSGAPSYRIPVTLGAGWSGVTLYFVVNIRDQSAASHGLIRMAHNNSVNNFRIGVRVDHDGSPVNRIEVFGNVASGGSQATAASTAALSPLGNWAIIGVLADLANQSLTVRVQGAPLAGLDGVTWPEAAGSWPNEDANRNQLFEASNGQDILGDFAAGVMYDTVLSSESIDALESYFADRYGITLTE